jgi:hypothetical protein
LWTKQRVITGATDAACTRAELAAGTQPQPVIDLHCIPLAVHEGFMHMAIIVRSAPFSHGALLGGVLTTETDRLFADRPRG